MNRLKHISLVAAAFVGFMLRPAPALAASPPMPLADFSPARPWTYRAGMGWNSHDGPTLGITTDFAPTDNMILGPEVYFGRSPEIGLRVGYRILHLASGLAIVVALGGGYTSTLTPIGALDRGNYLAPGAYVALPLGGPDASAVLRLGVVDTLATLSSGSPGLDVPVHLAWRFGPSNQLTIGTEGIGWAWTY